MTPSLFAHPMIARQLIWLMMNSVGHANSDVYRVHPSLQGSGNLSHYTLFGRPHASVQSARKNVFFATLDWFSSATSSCIKGN